MPSSRVQHFFRRASVSMAVSMILAGCSLSEINKMERDITTGADTAQRIAQSRQEASHPTVVWSEKPWVNLKPVTPVVATPEDKSVPSCQVVINRPDGITLPELGQRITALCGVRVTITPDAFQALSSGNVSYTPTQQMSGTLPAPSDNGRVPLQQISGTSQSTAVALPAATVSGLKWQGELHGLLDMIASRLGLSWRSEQGNIVFYQLDTKTYQLVILNTKIDSSASINSGSGNQLGSGGGTSSGTTGDVSSAQKTSTDLSSNLYEDIRKTIENMLTPKNGRYWLSSATGTLTVTDTPEVLGRVGRYIEYQNRVLNRQVQLNIQILSFTQTRNLNLGMDVGLVNKTLHGFGATLNGSFANASDTSSSLGLSILDTATGSASRFSGSQLLIKALNEQGNVSVVTNQTRTSTNLTPVPYQYSNQQGILTSSSSTATANVGVTSTMTTTTLTTGLFMTMLPNIQDNGDVQLQFAFSYTSPPKIERFISKDGNTRNDIPNTTTEALTQRVNMKSGQTLVLTGTDMQNKSVDKQGAFTPNDFLSGGGQTGSGQRTTLVILITPVLLN
ncbi:MULTISPECIES: PilN family type IVB pilus formation outer membrane protein [Dickeya]|uniref:PilN family type IVB pilus formation outer membrane protein n=1 Tax=Dickeya oryzae TaxID=1240404 RepID=A0AB39IRC0_9GAMM|nr:MULTISPECIES: PilN family type IVB pilus formation outer membrane protein [Dickeya]MCA6985499.1 PilN family type IVB pilus formation outer membrane protein [Dickeya zeae]MCA6990826.1 PilN family type IVB pilus formation outer membrane protein [Dickeya oryzae]